MQAAFTMLFEPIFYHITSEVMLNGLAHGLQAVVLGGVLVPFCGLNDSTAGLWCCSCCGYIYKLPISQYCHRPRAPLAVAAVICSTVEPTARVLLVEVEASRKGLLQGCFLKQCCFPVSAATISSAAGCRPGVASSAGDFRANERPVVRRFV